ncbi:MAG: UDP-N-acetylmuramoyl-L-alanyl-D-glutamate--2,6-diaminopimelate ligase [Chlamydiota bacterium]
MKLKKILEGIECQKIKGSRDIEITGICGDSRFAAPGNLFLAKRGESFDGNAFIVDAIKAGASAIMSEVYNPFLENVVQIVHEDVSSVEAEIAARYYRFPAEELFMVGITGTNGKTTTTYLVKHILDGLQIPSGLIGTVEYITGKNRVVSSRTTPDQISLQKMLREMRMNECSACAMEVSSHGLIQERTKHVDFDVGIFTNLTLDHLDYHKTMEEYAKAKQKLFASLGNNGVAIINADSSYASFMAEPVKGRVLYYGIDAGCDIKAESISFSPRKSEFVVTYQDQREKFSSHLIGRFNVYNILAAIAVGISRGIPLRVLQSIISTFEQVPGRLERVIHRKNFHVFVDYAHSDDALQNVLLTLREIKKNRILTVFGCGGDRDRSKRSKMGKVSDELSDFTIITSDNPRSEDPKQIIEEIEKGFSSDRYIVELDRKEAITKAVLLALDEDIILIAGKGHEPYQIFSGQTFPFDDRLVAKEICDSSC